MNKMSKLADRPLYISLTFDKTLTGQAIARRGQRNTGLGRENTGCFQMTH